MKKKLLFTAVLHKFSTAQFQCKHNKMYKRTKEKCFATNVLGLWGGAVNLQVMRLNLFKNPVNWNAERLQIELLWKCMFWWGRAQIFWHETWHFYYREFDSIPIFIWLCNIPEHNANVNIYIQYVKTSSLVWLINLKQLGQAKNGLLSFWQEIQLCMKEMIKRWWKRDAHNRILTSGLWVSLISANSSWCLLSSVTISNIFNISVVKCQECMTHLLQW